MHESPKNAGEIGDGGPEADDMSLPVMLVESDREGTAAFGRLMPRRKELAALFAAAARGDLVGRPLAATEREVVRDALALSYYMACCDQIRQAILGADAP